MIFCSEQHWMINFIAFYIHSRLALHTNLIIFFGMIMSYETNIQMKVKSGEQNIGEKHSFNHKWWFFLVLKQKWFFGILFFWELLNVEWRKAYVEKFDLPNKSEFLFLATAKLIRLKNNECVLHHGLLQWVS